MSHLHLDLPSHSKMRYLLIDFSDNATKARGYVQHGIYQNVNK